MATQQYQDFATVYDRLMSDVDYAAWARYLSQLLSFGGISPDESVLDCACGTGEITIRLHQAGYRMTGVDNSEQMLERAQQKARKAGAKIPFVCQDMRELGVHKPVSAITCACDGVNYLLTMQDVDSFFRSANRALKPEGLLLFDVSSAYKLEHVLHDSTFGDDDPTCAYLWQNCYDEKTHLLDMRLTFFTLNKDGTYTRFDERHTQRAHEIDELKEALDRAGFLIEGIYDAFTKDALKPESERIQLIARKKTAV